MFDCLVPRLAALLLLCAAGTAQVIEYAHVLSFAESCQQGPVISAAAVRLDFCTHFPSGGFYKHTWDKDSQAVKMQSYLDEACLDTSGSPTLHPILECDEPRQYLVLGKFDTPQIDPSAIAAFGAGDFCVVERTTGCEADFDGYEYVRDGECIYVGGANVVMSCTGSQLTVQSFEGEAHATCDEKTGDSTTGKGECAEAAGFWRVGGGYSHASFIEKISIGSSQNVALGEAIAGAISAVATVAIVGSAAGAASSSAAGSAAGSGGAGGGGAGGGGGASGGSASSTSLTSIWLLLFQIQFLSLISSMGSETMKAFGSSLSWANLYSAIQGVGTECDNEDAEEEATGGILVFFLLVIPVVILHIVLLVSIHAYVKVKAAHIKFKTPKTLQFPRIELRLFIVALAGQTYAYSRLAACGEDGGAVFGGVLLLLLFPIPFLALVFHIVVKLKLSDGLVAYQPDDSMKFDNVKAAVTPVGQRMLENVKKLQSPETDICRGDWASVKEDNKLKDDFLGRYGVIFEDYTQSGAKYAFVFALCTVATSFFLATADSEAASVLVFLIYLTQYVLLVVWSPFNNAVINAQEIAAGFFNLITLMIVMAGVHQDADELFEDAMYLQIFVILIKGFPGVIAAAQALVQVSLLAYRYWKAKQVADAAAAETAEEGKAGHSTAAGQPDNNDEEEGGAKSAAVSPASTATAEEAGAKDDDESKAKDEAEEGEEEPNAAATDAVLEVTAADMEEEEAAAVESLVELYRLSRQIAKSTSAEGSRLSLTPEEKQQFKKEFLDLSKHFTMRTAAETTAAARESARRSMQLKDAVARASVQLRASTAFRSSMAPQPATGGEEKASNDDAQQKQDPPQQGDGNSPGAKDVEDFGFDDIHASNERESYGSPDKV